MIKLNDIVIISKNLEPHWYKELENVKLKITDILPNETIRYEYEFLIMEGEFKGEKGIINSSVNFTLLNTNRNGANR